MSFHKCAVLLALLAVAEARFDQEQLPVAAFQALDGLGEPGVVATLAGGIPSSLLAAASPCDKLTIADDLIAELGTTNAAVLSAARELVGAETNFNPFAVEVPFVCADPLLPTTEELRGVTPLVDPAVVDAEIANAAAEESLTTPFDATGLSQAEVLIAQGFTQFTAVDATGENVVLAGQDDAAAGAGAGAEADAEDDAEADAGEDAGDDAGAEIEVGVGAGNATAGVGGAVGDAHKVVDDGDDVVEDDADAVDDADNAAEDADVVDDDAEAVEDGAAAGGAAEGELDFGICQPTMAFIGGLNGRPADEFTFIPQDPLIADGQQEALNPNIITNRICDQVGASCGASEAAIQACLDAQAEIEALGTRDQATADTFNALVGFAGQDTTVEQV